MGLNSPKIIFLIVFLLFFIPHVNALCPEITLAKTSFFPGETLQAEINGNFIRDISPTDISVVRQSDNVRLPLEVIVVKISNQKFFAFFDIPSLNINFEENYLLKVAARCNDGFFVRSKQLIIKKPVADYYGSFESQISSWQYLTKEEHAAALMAVYYKQELYQPGRLAFNSKGCPGSCNIIENSFATIATKEQIFSQWIENNANGDCWGSPCDPRKTAHALLTLKLVNKSINESSIAWLQANAQEDEEKAILVYLNGENYNELILRQSYQGYWLKANNPDISTTVLATFALKNIVETISDPQEKIITMGSIEKAERWLLQNFYSGTKKEKALTLFFVFPKENIEAIMSVWPGVVKIESPASFSLILQNKGTNNLTALVSTMNTSTAIYLPAGSLKSIQFSVPLMTTPDARALFQKIELYYENIYGYSSSFDIPLIIFTQLGETTTIVPITTNETNISTQQQIEEIKNETTLNQTNKTTQQEPALIETVLSFDEEEIFRNITLGQSASIVLRLNNKLNQEIKNVYIQQSSILSLMGGISIEPSFISKMDSKSSEDILITIAPERGGYYEGTIDASVKINDKLYKESVIFKIDVFSGATNATINQTKTCAEIGGKECEQGQSCSVNTVITKDTYKCCIPPTNCKKVEEENNAPLIGIIIFSVVVIALIVVLIILSRKKKKQMSEILDEAKQKYETNFQRKAPR